MALACPSRTHFADVRVFKKSKAEKEKTASMKKTHRAAVLAQYGPGSKRKLNLPGKSLAPIKLSL
jgi:hypothetical protein